MLIVKNNHNDYDNEGVERFGKKMDENVRAKIDRKIL